MEKKRLSKRQRQADELRMAHKDYTFGLWTPFNMSNRQVIKKFRVNAEKTYQTKRE